MDVLTSQPATSASASGNPSQSSRGESSVSTAAKSRSACNRCHAQKLKCAKRAGQASSCERCFRLKTSCRFGPRTARSSLKIKDQLAIEITLPDPLSVPASVLVPHSDSNIAGVNKLGWLPLPETSTHANAGCVTQGDSYSYIPDYFDREEICWDTLPRIENGANHLTGFDSSANFDLLPVHDNATNTDNFESLVTSESGIRIDNQDTMDLLDLNPPSIVQILANLNVALYECGLELLSPLTTKGHSAGSGIRKRNMFVLDDLFRLTTEFLNVLTSLSHDIEQLNVSPSSTIQIESSTGSTLPLFPYDQHLSETAHSAGMEASIKPFSFLNEAAMFMLMSCHCRLTEIYESVFKMIQACIKHSLAPRRDKNWAIVLPQLHVGSVALPPVQVDIDTPVSPTTSSMYMLMITTLSSQVWGQFVDKMRVLDGSSMRMGSRDVLTEIVWQKMTDVNHRMLQTIDNTKHLLQ